MDGGTLKRQERLEGLQRANLLAWQGHLFEPAGQLDANIKKNTGFIKKCKTNLGQESAQLVREVKILKLEKYVSEIVPAVLEGMLKFKTGGEYAAGINVISALHARFPKQFTAELVGQMLRLLVPPSLNALGAMSAEQREREEQARLGRQKVVLRMLGEMFVSGLLWAIDTQPEGVGELDLAAAFALSRAPITSNKTAAKVKDMVQQPGHCVLVGALQNLFLSDREHHLSIALATGFAKTFKADFGLGQDESDRSFLTSIECEGVGAPVVTTETCKRVQAVLQEYLSSAVERLQTMFRGLAKMRKSNEERLFNKGALHADIKEKFERNVRSFSKLSDNVNALCDVLGRARPQLEDLSANKDQLGIVFDTPSGSAAGAPRADSTGVWEDEEERTFYENLLDLQSRLPPSMLEPGRRQPQSPESSLKETAAEGDQDADDFGDIGESSISTEVDASDSSDDDASNAVDVLEYQKFIERRRGQSTGADAAADDENSSAVDTRTVVQQTGTASGYSLAPLRVADVLQRLTTVATRNDADEIAVNFCYINSRANRRALVNTLIDAPRRQMYLIPFYARVIATLNPYFAEIGESVVDELNREFSWLARKRVRGLLEARLKNVRYIAELAKFGVAPLHVPFRCAKVLLEQPHTHNLEVLCALLDACGRYLRAQPKTAERMDMLLGVLLRRRRTLNLDDHTLQLIENAHQACQPHTHKAEKVAKYRTPLELYVRKLVYEDLNSTTADAVFKQLRRLPWGDGTGTDAQRVRHALLCCFTKAWKVKHAHVYLLAMTLSSLGYIYPWFRISVVDTVLENIKLGLERNDFSRNQQRIAEVFYVGEMFIFNVVSVSEVVALVQLFISYGYGHNERLPTPGRSCELDAASDYFRVRLICTLLSTCGRHICRAENLHVMHELGLLVQMYVLAKDQPLPVDIEYSIDGLYGSVFAGVVRCETWEEAAHALAAFNRSDASPVVPQMEPPPADSPVELAHQDVETEASDYSDKSDYSPDIEDAAIDEEAQMEEARRQMEAMEALLDREEEESLEREFNQLSLESTDMRRGERSALDVGIPMNLIGQTRQNETTDPNSMRFALLAGKKQRPVVHRVSIPAESQIAQTVRMQEESALRERAHLKRIVLNYERREAEEEKRQIARELSSKRMPSAHPNFEASFGKPGGSRRRQYNGAGGSRDGQRRQEFHGIPDHFL
ncbi:mRNA decay protein [Coemansia brasiliensis]|uniref:mRNA decay protein n=1 Tax=Coemansia brasiliensis TaxID=2650707 RepID=A0A9W8IKA0_9FUNG|nr:mRNA decay protein [Coemansia brasiliensis]